MAPVNPMNPRSVFHRILGIFQGTAKRGLDASFYLGVIQSCTRLLSFGLYIYIWAMVNTHYMVDGHPIHNKDPYNGYYKSL